jgi:hypothetical protein
MISALLLWLAPAVETCSACARNGLEVRLCAPHADEDRLVLAREGKRLRSKDEAERLATLEAAANLTRAHENAPSPRVVKFLGGALKSESVAVRVRAAQLLGPPQHAVASLDELLGALKAHERDLDKEFEDGFPSVPGLGRDTSIGKLSKEIGKAKKEAEALWARVEVLTQGKAAICTQLALFPDDRAVSAILDCDTSDAGLRALVRLGSRSALDGVRAEVEGWIADEGRLGEKAGPYLEFHDARSRLLREELAALPGLRGLPGPSQAGELDEWRDWLRVNRDAFPEHLPGVRSPVW